jgi:phospholipase C
VNRIVFALAASVVLLVPAHAGAAPASLTGIHKIRHIVVIMLVNRSFDC